MHRKKRISQRRVRLDNGYDEREKVGTPGSDESRDALEKRGQKRLWEKTLGHVGLQRLESRVGTIWPQGK